MLLLKLLLVPSLVALVTLIGRRWGPSVAGWFAGFPVVAGPILFLVASEQGAGFAAVAAGGALAATGANVAFCLAYAWTGLTRPWWVSLAAGFAAFLVVACLAHAARLPDTAMLAVVVSMIAIGGHLFPRGPAPLPAARPPRSELAVRMLAAGVLVVVVTFFADALGPFFSGILSAPPLIASVLAAFSHAVSGTGFMVRLLQSMVSGFYALATFCWCLTLWLPHRGIGLAFASALACATLVTTGITAFTRRRAAGRRS